MAKKSNKTEQVLRLITKDEETRESLSEKELGTDLDFLAEEPKLPPSEVKISVKPKEEQELKYEAKLKIEIEPEIELKAKESEVQKIQAEPIQESDESSLIEQSDHLINIAEVLVKEKIALVMKKMNVCSCTPCMNDVLALALNSLPTKYVTTDAGKQYYQLDIYKKQYETDVLAALTKACVRVKASPRHSDKR